MPYAKSGDTSIYYEVHGDGPPVLLVHGSGGNHAAWWQQTAALMGEYQVINIDLRGFGNSDSVPEGPDSQDFPADILAVLEHCNAIKAVLIGQSIGAAAALKAALRQPQRVAGVILANSLGGLSHPDIAPLVRADRAVAEQLPVMDRLLTQRFRKEQAAKAFLFEQMGTFNQATMQDLRNLNSGGPTFEEVRAAGIKVCFLAGENDMVLRPATVSKAHELFPGSTLVIVPGAPHSMYWESPDLFNAAVIGFLKQVHRA